MTSEELQAIIDDRIEARMKDIAALAAKEVLQQFYAEIGRGVLRKVAWGIGIIIMAIATWLAARNNLMP